MAQRTGTIQKRESNRDKFPIRFKNNSSETIPPRAIVQIESVEGVPTGKQTLVVVKKPTGSDGEYIVNGPFSVRAGKRGCGRIIDPLVIRYTGTTPSIGNSIGPSSSSWDVSTTGSGYIVLGGAEDGVVLVRRSGGSNMIFGITASSGMTAAAKSGDYVTKGTGSVRRYSKTDEVGHEGEYKKAAADETWGNLLFQSICGDRPVTADRIDGNIVVVSEGWKAA